MCHSRNHVELVKMGDVSVTMNVVGLPRWGGGE